jgi:ABC-2 type transport system ATP-binding protein
MNAVLDAPAPAFHAAPVARTSPPVVRARGLRKAYKNRLALDSASFEIPAGRIVGLIGPNGAGKTTALKAMLGLIPFDGDLTVLGRDPRTQRDELMRDVCFIADVAVLPRWMTVAQAIRYVGGVHPRFDAERCARFLHGTQLRPKMKVREMSKGMIVQLHLALVMAIDAKLLVLDEPTLGLDILYRKQFYQRLLEDYFDEDKTIVVTTHQVEEIEHILTDVIFIRDGRIALHADMDAVTERYTEVLVEAGSLAAARAFKPIDERSLPFGRTVMLFDGVDEGVLTGFGDTRKPGLADLFVATMKGAYA